MTKQQIIKMLEEDFKDVFPVYVLKLLTALIELSSVDVTQTFAEVQASGEDARMILVLNDEENDGEATLYLWTGTELQWIPTQTV